MMMQNSAYDSLPMNDFATGFRVGWESVNGRSQAPVVAPLPPRVGTFAMTPFLDGVRAGVEQALGVDDLDDCRKDD